MLKIGAIGSRFIHCLMRHQRLVLVGLLGHLQSAFSAIAAIKRPQRRGYTYTWELYTTLQMSWVVENVLLCAGDIVMAHNNAWWNHDWIVLPSRLISNHQSPPGSYLQPHDQKVFQTIKIDIIIAGVEGRNSILISRWRARDDVLGNGMNSEIALTGT